MRCLFSLSWSKYGETLSDFLTLIIFLLLPELAWGEREKEGESQEDKRSSSCPLMNSSSALWMVEPGPGVTGLPHSHSVIFLSKRRLTSASICVECFRPGPVDGLANVSLPAWKARCGCGWWNASSSFASGESSQRQDLLWVATSSPNPVYSTALWETEETRTNVYKDARHFSYVLTQPPNKLEAHGLLPTLQMMNLGLCVW